MGRYKYTTSEKNINAVLGHQNVQLKSISFPAASETDECIANSESLLASLGYSLPKKGAVPHHGRQPLVIPSWNQILDDALRAGKDGTQLESLFTEDELEANTIAVAALNEEYDQIHRLDPIDVTIAVGSGILAAVIDILLVGIPKKTPSGLRAGTLSNYIRDYFEERYPADEMEKLANSTKSKVPYDAQDNRNTTVHVEGLSAYYHRLLSLGHDPLLGLLFGTSDILTGKMTTIDKAGNIVSQAMECYTGRRETDVFVALAKQILHFKSDVTTSMGLPVPLMAMFNLMQFGCIGEYEQTVAEIAQGMYFEGYDFIHFCSMSAPTALVEVTVRLCYAFKRIKEGAPLKDAIPLSTSREKNPKLATMLFTAHCVATAANAGKIAFTENPMAINYPQWIAFAKYSYQQLKWVMLTKPAQRDTHVHQAIENDLCRTYADIHALFDVMYPETIVIDDPEPICRDDG